MIPQCKIVNPHTFVRSKVLENFELLHNLLGAQIHGNPKFHDFGFGFPA